MPQSSLPDQPSAPEPPGRRGASGPNTGRSGRTRALVAAAVAAAAALAAVGFFLVSSGGENGGGTSDARGATRHGKELFTIKAPDVTDTDAEDGVELFGSWVTDDIYARGTGNAVVGVDPVSGKRKWKLPLDGLICGAADHLSGSGRTAVVVSRSKSTTLGCDRLVVFDVHSGRKEWEKKMPDDGFADPEVDVAVGRRLVAAKSSRGWAAYRISGGPPLRTSEPGTRPDCWTQDLSGGRKVTAVVVCGDGDKDVDVKVQRLTPGTGKPDWEFTVPGDTEYAQVVSEEPLVLATGTDLLGTRITGMTVVGKDRTLTSRITLDAPRSAAGCSWGEGSPCASTVVDDTHLYLPSRPHPADGHSSRTTNRLLAFDLRTGKRTWALDPGDAYEIHPLRMEGDTLLAYRRANDGSGGAVVAIDPGARGRKQEIRLRTPDTGAGAGLGPESGTRRYENGRLYLQQRRVRQFSKASGEEYATVAFGTES